MAKQRKAWVFSPEKKSKSSLSGALKDEVEHQRLWTIEATKEKDMHKMQEREK